MAFIDVAADYKLAKRPKKDIVYNIEVWVKRYKKQVRSNKTGKKTQKAYAEALRTFVDFLELHKDQPIDKIGATLLNRYIVHYQYVLAQKAYRLRKIPKKDLVYAKKLQNSKSLGDYDSDFEVLEQFENSITQRITVIKMFLKYVSENNKEQHDFTESFGHIVKIKHREKEAPYLTEKELFAVIDFMKKWPDVYKEKNHKPKSSQRYAYRDAFLLLIYALSGARSEEVTKIKLSEIQEHSKNNTDYYIIDINNGKGGHNRKIAIKKEHIQEFVEYFRAQLPDENYYISSTYRNGYTNNYMHPNTIRKFANYVLQLLGIKKSGLHAFRRGYATYRIMTEKAGIEIVSKELGNTPEILFRHYLKHNPEDIMDSKS